MKLISLNIEGDKHLDRCIPFLRQESADVVCLQEVFEADLDTIRKGLGMRFEFVPILQINDSFNGKSAKGDWGIALFFKELPHTVTHTYYANDTSTKGVLPVWDGRSDDIWKQAVILATFESGITIATTHFAWSPKGTSTEYQRAYMKDLINVLSSERDVVLCGDLNAPRGRATWQMLADIYTDNIPPDVTTTLDQNLHEVSGLQYVVDAMFTGGHCVATDVQVIDGVSDHMAIVARIDVVK